MSPTFRDPAAKRAAFEAEALPYLQAVYSLALRLTRHAPDAADLAQETFLRAYRTFENFTPGTNAKAWLFTILYSVHINAYHRRRRQPPGVPLEELEARSHGVPHTPAAEWAPEWDPEVRRALDALREDFRAAVLLVDVGGLTYEEAAAALACPVGTVRSRLYRARRALYTALRDYARRAGFRAEVSER